MGKKSFNLGTQCNAIKLLQTFQQEKCVLHDVKFLVNKDCYEYKVT